MSDPGDLDLPRPFQMTEICCHFVIIFTNDLGFSLATKYCKATDFCSIQELTSPVAVAQANYIRATV